MPQPHTPLGASAPRRRVAVLAAATIVGAALVIAAMQWLPSRSDALDNDESDAHPAPLVREPAGGEHSAEEARVADAGQRARASASDPPASDSAATPLAESPPEVPTLVGRVVDGEGRPLRALVVVAESTGFGIPIELEELALQLDELETERTQSDDDGRFRFDAKLDLSYGVVLYIGAPGHVPLRLDRLPLGASTNEEGTIECGDIQLVRGATVRARVVDRRGHAIPNAAVRLAIVAGEQTFEMDVHGQGPLVATSDAGGGFTLDGLAPGPFTLLVDAPGYVTARATGVAVTAKPVSLEIVLEIGARIAGRIVGRAPGVDDSYGALRVELRPGAETPMQIEVVPEGDAEDDRTHAQRLRTGLVGADGSFEVTGLLLDVPHTLIVTTERPNGRFERVPEVAPMTIDPATRRVDVPWQALGRARLRVIDAVTGAPIERFGIEWCAMGARPRQALEFDEGWGDAVEHDWQSLPEDQDDTDTRHADGRVVLSPLGPLGEPLSIVVELAAPGYDRHSFTSPTFVASLTTDLGEVRLEPRPEVRVTVQRALDGAPIEHATVYIVRTEEEDLAWWVESGREPLFEDVSSGVTDAAGTVRLPSLLGGRVAVGARVPRGVVEKPLELELSHTGGEELVLEVAEGGVLVVQVEHPNKTPAENVWVVWRHASLQHEPSFRATNRSGTVTVANLAAGLYQVATPPLDQRATYEWRPVEVTNGGTARVQLTAAHHATLVGRISENHAPVAGARVLLQVPAARESLQEGVDPSLADIAWGDGEIVVASCLSKADGSFLLGPVALGEFEVVVHHFERALPVTVSVTLRQGVNRVDVVLPVTSIEGRLVDHEKLPWVGAWVRVHDLLASSSSYGSVPGMSESPTGEVRYTDRGGTGGYVYTDGEGRFRVRGVSEGRALTLYTGADFMESMTLEVPPLANGEHRDLGTLVRDALGELSVTLETPPTGPFELKLFDAELDVELVERRVSLESGDGGGSWSLARGHYRVELHDPARPGEPRSAEAVVEPRLQTNLSLP